MIFKPFIDRWGGDDANKAPNELAADLGIPAKNVRRWIDSDSIPAEWFAAIVRAAGQRGFDDVTADRLIEMAEERRLSRASGDPEARGAAA